MQILKRSQLLALVSGMFIFMNINGAANSSVEAVSKEATPINHGLWIVQDKKGQAVSIEWQMIDSFENYSALARQVLPIHAEAFCDEMKDYLLDESFQVKPEYAKLVRSFLADDGMDELNQEFKQYIELCRTGSRQDRIASSMKSGESRIQSFWSEHSHHKLVMALAKKEDKVLGYALFYLAHPYFPENTAFLQEIAILPEAQKLGLSKPLIFSILAIASKTGFRKNRIILDTNIWNTNAQQVYKHLGFSEIEGIWTSACKGFEYNAV